MTGVATDGAASRRWGVIAAILLLCVAYVALQWTYIRGLPLVMDEFAGAYQVYKIGDGLPYRDYLPYKTVLGYALQWPLLAASDDPWQAMLNVKLGMAVLSAGVLGWAALHLSRGRAGAPVCLSLALLFFQSTFAERSAELRVDMLTACFGLVSLVMLLGRRYVLAGVWAGASLLVSQKGAFYVVPAVAVFGGQFLLGLVGSSARSGPEMVQLPGWLERWSGSRLHWPLRGVLFCLPIGVALGAYWGLFGVLAGFSRVFGRVAVSPKGIAFSPMYEDLRDYWWQTLERNPVFYGAALGCWLLLLLLWLRLSGQRDWRRDVLLVYSAVLSGLCVWHKQPWPYFFVLLLPTLWVLIADGLVVAWSLLAQRLAAVRRTVRGAVALSLIGLLVLGGVVLPLQRAFRVWERDATFQRSTLAAAAALLGEDGTYFAGTQLLWWRQHTPRTSWLDKRRLAQVNAQPELALSALESTPPKIVVFTHRLEQLPASVRAWFAERYVNVAGNLFSAAYALGNSQVELPHAGPYKLWDATQSVALDGQAIAPGAVVTLQAGRHEVAEGRGAKLVVWSTEPEFLDYVGTTPGRFFYNHYRY